MLFNVFLFPRILVLKVCNVELVVETVGNVTDGDSIVPSTICCTVARFVTRPLADALPPVNVSFVY